MIQVHHELEKFLSKSVPAVSKHFEQEFYKIPAASHIEAIWILIECTTENLRGRAEEVRLEIQQLSNELKLLKSEENPTPESRSLGKNVSQKSREESLAKKISINSEFLRKFLRIKRSASFLGSDRTGSGYWAIKPFRSKLENDAVSKGNNIMGIIVERNLYTGNPRSFEVFTHYAQIQKFYQSVMIDLPEETLLRDQIKNLKLESDPVKLNSNFSAFLTWSRDIFRSTPSIQNSSVFDKHFGAMMVAKLLDLSDICELGPEFDDKILQIHDQRVGDFISTLQSWHKDGKFHRITNKRIEELNQAYSHSHLFHWCGRALESAKTQYRKDKTRTMFENKGPPAISPIKTRDRTINDRDELLAKNEESDASDSIDVTQDSNSTVDSSLKSSNPAMQVEEDDSVSLSDSDAESDELDSGSEAQSHTGRSVKGPKKYVKVLPKKLSHFSDSSDQLDSEYEYDAQNLFKKRMSSESVIESRNKKKRMHKNSGLTIDSSSSESSSSDVPLILKSNPSPAILAKEAPFSGTKDEKRAVLTIISDTEDELLQ
jgi:hypothetical protein